jgi:hypothetical protein|nr:MAG: hypothetical protein J07AB56_00580 [Candidatus Nanosalinarum sp. J07AB56]
MSFQISFTIVELNSVSESNFYTMFEIFTKDNAVETAKNPEKAVSFLRYKFSEIMYYSKFSRFGDCSSSLDNYGKAVKQITEEFQDISGKTRGESYSPGIMAKTDAENLKGFVEYVDPSVVVETGVCNGISTLSILEGMEELESVLYSIDLPESPSSDEGDFWGGKGGSVIPNKKAPGWVVPESLRTKWNLILGNSLYRLPEVMEESGEVDIFIHDSEHSYEMMMFEFCLAWKHLREGGYLICDDHKWNSAFSDFADQKDITKYKLGKLGLLEK